MFAKWLTTLLWSSAIYTLTQYSSDLIRGAILVPIGPRVNVRVAMTAFRFQFSWCQAYHPTFHRPFCGNVKSFSFRRCSNGRGYRVDWLLWLRTLLQTNKVSWPILTYHQNHHVPHLGTTNPDDDLFWCFAWFFGWWIVCIDDRRNRAVWLRWLRTLLQSNIVSCLILTYHQKHHMSHFRTRIPDVDLFSFFACFFTWYIAASFRTTAVVFFLVLISTWDAIYV